MDNRNGVFTNATTSDCKRTRAGTFRGSLFSGQQYRVTRGDDTDYTSNDADHADNAWNANDACRVLPNGLHCGNRNRYDYNLYAVWNASRKHNADQHIWHRLPPKWPC